MDSDSIPEPKNIESAYETLNEILKQKSFFRSVTYTVFIFRCWKSKNFLMQNFSKTPKAQNIFSMDYIDVYVVFVLIFTEPASECVCEGGMQHPLSFQKPVP